MMRDDHEGEPSLVQVDDDRKRFIYVQPGSSTWEKHGKDFIENDLSERDKNHQECFDMEH